MSKRCKLQKEYYKEFGNYKGSGKYTDHYVNWLESKVLAINYTRCCTGVCDKKNNVGYSYFTSADLGDKFKVIKSNQWHSFKLGETVTLKCVAMAEDDEYKFESENDYWYLGFADVEKL